MGDRYVVEEIRQRISIEEVVSQITSLKPSTGGRLLGLCPFHQEDTPSFTVNPSQGFYYCFGCGEGGDLFRFIMNTQSIDFPTALKQLADHCGIALKAENEKERINRKQRGSILEACEETSQYFQSSLLSPHSDMAKEALGYLKGRGLSMDTIRKFQLGFIEHGDGLISALHRKGFSDEILIKAGIAKQRDSSNRRRGIYSFFRQRIIIPIFNPQGKVIAFGGRCMPGQENTAKYINSPESDSYKKSKTLYGLSYARPCIQRKGRVILVEGYFDVISMHQAGFTECVATCGTALTEQHLQIIRPLASDVYTLFDMDQAGTRAVTRSLPLFLEGGIEALRIELHNAKDPDEFLLENGPEEMERCISKAEPLLTTQLQLLIDTHGLNPSGIDKIITELVPLLRKMKPVSKTAAQQRVSSALGIPEGIISQRVGNTKKIKTKSVESETSIVQPLLLDLIWLLVHYPSEVQSEFSKLNPQEVSDDNEILQVVGHLMSGVQFTDAISKCSNTGIKNTIMGHVVHPKIFESASLATRAAPEIVVRLRIIAQKKVAHHLQFQITQYESKKNQDELIDIIHRYQHVQKQLSDLQNQLQNIYRI